MLRVEGVSAGYGDSQALYDVTLDVKDGETVVVLGPNGHGKTTLLRTISGLNKAWSGSIEFDGKRLDDKPAYSIVNAGVIHIPQGDMLFPELTVLDNLMLGAYPSHTWKMRQEKLQIVYKVFPRLQERTTQLARSLSGGERRMLALGRGMMGDAKLLMVDEPSLGLAPKLVEEVYDSIAEIKAHGVSVLLVDEKATHVGKLADRLALMASGRIIKEGSVGELLKEAELMEAYF